TSPTQRCIWPAMNRLGSRGSRFLLMADIARSERVDRLAATFLGCMHLDREARFPQRRPAMSYSISTLLLRNLSDVFGENDPVRRRAAIDEIFHEDAVFHDPKGGMFRGRDEIDRIAGL